MIDKNKQAVAIFNKLAEGYQSKFMDVSMYHETFDIFCDNIKKKNPEILELACGPGNITKYLLTKRPDLNILATDLAPRMIELAQINCPEAKFQIMDCRELNTLNHKFDGIMCGFCLPYLNMEEVEKLISSASAALNTGGVIYLSTMEDDYEKSGFKKGSSGDEIFMHFYTQQFLVHTLEKNGFNILNISKKTYPQNDSSIVVDISINAQLQ